MSAPTPTPNPTPTPDPTPTPTPAAPGGTPLATFTQEQLDTIIADRLARQQRAIDAKTTKDRADAEAAKLAEQGEFKKLAETAQAERDALKGQLADRDHADLQRAVAVEQKLPAEMATRLRGATREELTADAKELAKLVTQPPAPPVPGNRPNPRPQSGADPGSEVEAHLRASGRYNAI